MNILINVTQRWGETESNSSTLYPNPQRKTTGNLPSGVANSVMKRNFLYLGGTTIDSMTPEIKISQSARTVSKSNTKGYRIIPYSGWLK